MSGPKCGSYTVETAQAREARELAAALAAYRQVHAEYAELCREAEIARAAFGPAIEVPGPLPEATGTGAGIRDAEQDAHARLRTATDRLRSSAAAAGRARWTEVAETVVDDRRFDLSITAATAAAPRAETVSLDAHLAELAEIAAAWPVAAGTGPLDAATAEVGAARSTSAAALGVARVRDELARLRAAERAERDRVVALGGLRARIESVRDWPGAGPEAAELLADVGAPDAEPGALLDRVDRFVAAAHSRRDRTEAGAILADVLTEMGYTLADGFTTHLDGSADVLAGRPGWSEHAVSFRLDGAGKVYTHVVRAADATEDDDAQVDREFCDDYDALLARAGRRGLRLDTVRRFEPGTRPLRAVDRSRVGEVAATPARRAPRERSR